MSGLRVALTLLCDARFCSAIVLINQIDKIVNSTLYNFGMVFCDAWLNLQKPGSLFAEEIEENGSA